MRMQVPILRGLRATTPFPFPGIFWTSSRSFTLLSLTLRFALVGLSYFGCFAARYDSILPSKFLISTYA